MALSSTMTAANGAPRHQIRLPVRYRKECATLLVLISVATEFVGVSISLPILVEFASSLGVHASNVGLVFSVGAFAALLSNFWLPSVSDTTGRKSVLMLSLVGSAISYALQAAAPSFDVLLFSIFLGRMFGGTQPVAVAYISDIFSPLQRPRLIGMVPACASACYIIGPTLGGVLAKMSDSFRVPLAAAAILVAVMLPIVQFFLPDSKVLVSEAERTFLERQQAEEHEKMRKSIFYTTSQKGASLAGKSESSSLISDRVLQSDYSPLLDWRCQVCFWIQFFNTAAFSAFTTCIPLILGEPNFHLSGNQDNVLYTGIVIGCGAAAKSIGLIVLFDRIQQRIGLPRTICTGALFAFSAFFLLSFQSSIGGMATGFSLFTLGISLLQPGIFSYVTVIVPQEFTARAIGVPNAAISLGQMIGPIASTKLLAVLDYHHLLQIFSAALMVQFLLSLSFLRAAVDHGDKVDESEDIEEIAYSQDEFETKLTGHFVEVLTDRNYNLADQNTQKALLEMIDRSFPFLREKGSENKEDIEKLMHELSIPFTSNVDQDDFPASSRRPVRADLRSQAQRGRGVRASVIGPSF